MAMTMEMPAVPNQPAAPQAKSEKTAQGSQDGFRTALNEENLKQAKGPAAKSEKGVAEKEEDPRQVATEVAATGTAGALIVQSEKTRDSVPVADGSAFPADGPGAQAEIAATILEQAVTDNDETVAGVLRRTPAETAIKVSRDASSKAPTSIVEVPVPELGDGVDTVNNATRDAGENRSGEVRIPQPAASTTGQIARLREVVLPQPMQGQPDQAESKTGRSGLMEASFAGLLQSAAPKGQTPKGSPEPAIRTEAGEIQLDGEENPLAPNVSKTVIGEADADLSEALLKKATGQPAPSEQGKNPAAIDEGKPSSFDDALASLGTGKPGTTAESSYLQDAAQQVRSAAGSLNEEVRILDQVLNQLPLNRMSEKNRVVIRLHPEELGEVKLDLVMDKDQLKAHLVTQTQQVQNILEKHLPRLQEALQNQGVKLDQIQVSVDSQSNQGREFLDRNPRPAPWVRSFNPHPAAPEVAQAASAVSQTRANQGSLSLRI